MVLREAIFLILALFCILITFVIFRLLPEIEGDAPIPFQQQFKVLGSIVILSGLLFTFFRESGNSILFTYLTPFIQDILHAKSSSISIITSIVHLGLAAGAGAGGILISNTSTVYYNPWLASFIVTLGLAAALVSFLSGNNVKLRNQTEKL